MTNNMPHFISNTSYLLQNDENIIHVNKYRFPEFYFEELDKLNGKYYNNPSDSYDIEHKASITESINAVQSNEEEEPNNINPKITPISVPTNNKNYTQNTRENNNIRRFSINSLNSFINSPPNSNELSPGLDMSISPPISNINELKPNITNHKFLPGYSSNNDTTTARNINNHHINNPSTSHKIIIKRVYDNYITFNIDSLLASITDKNNYQQSESINKYAADTLQDFICDQLDFICSLIPAQTDNNNITNTRNINPLENELNINSFECDPFNLFNISTIGLLFDRMNKSKFSFKLAYNEIMTILNELTRRNTSTECLIPVVKQSFLDSAIGILQNTSLDLLRPNIAVEQILLKSLGEYIKWIYSNYATNYWLSPTLLTTSYNLAVNFSARFGINLVSEIYNAIRLYFIPGYLYSVARASWKFTNIHRRQINKLRSIIIPPSPDTYWIIKTLEQSQHIPWIYPDTPHIRNIIVFIDGRNWFYMDNTPNHASTGINLELFHRFISSSEYKSFFADLVYNRITELMTSGRQLAMRDPRFVIPIFIFNEKHRQHIQTLGNTSHNIIYTPRGKNDDLMTLYLWLSNPGSFIASNDNFGEHAARIQQHKQQYKYFEGLWIQLIQCFKFINPLPNYITRNRPNTHKIDMKPYISNPGTSAPF